MANINILPSEIIYLHAEYVQSDYISKSFNYKFSGKILKKINTEFKESNNQIIPYTYFKVKVEKKLKGEILDNIIIIKFYGGFDSKNKLILLENMDYPNINTTYTFKCNKPINNLYIISSKENMTLAETKTEDLKPSVNYINTDYSFENNDGSSTSNYTFDTAVELDLELTYSLSYNEKPLYFKYKQNTLDYMSIYTTGSQDTEITLYDENKKFITTQDNISLGTKFTDEPNFLLNFYCDKNKTYYFEIKSKTKSNNNYMLHIVQDNWYTCNPTELFLPYDSVDNNYTVHYKIESKYINSIESAFKEWEKLNKIKFIKDAFTTNNNVKFIDYTNTDYKAPVAYTQTQTYTDSFVAFNLAYFEKMTDKERLKTILHECGHVLGLNEFTNKANIDNVMVQGIRELEKLGPTDIAIFDLKWPYQP